MYRDEYVICISQDDKLTDTKSDNGSTAVDDGYDYDYYSHDVSGLLS